MTVALLLPITYVLEPTSAFIMFAGIYYGGMYGGSTTSILLNTPGESSSIMTALEGNKMAKAGRGAAALGTAAIGSFVAGTIATLLLALVAPTVVKLAIAIGAGRLLRAGPARLRRRGHRARAPHRSAAWRRCASACSWDWSAPTCSPGSSASPSASRSSPTGSTWSSSRSHCSPSGRRCTWPRGCGTDRCR